MLVGHSELQHFNQAHQDHQPFFVMDDPTIQLDAQGEVRRLKVTGPEVGHYLVPLGEDAEEIEEVSGLDIIAELTEEDLEEEFNKLSASDRIKYNEWVQFHQEYQQTHRIAGTSSQIIRYISNLNKPAIPKEIVREELKDVDIDENQVQIVRMIDQDGNTVKKVKPILIKKEINREYATKVPFKKHIGEISFEDDECIPYRETPPVEYYEEVTDDEDYKEDDEVLSIESDSSAVVSMLDEDFEDINPARFDASLIKITTGLQQAAEGYEELRNMIPTIPVTDIPKLIEETPLPYLTPLSKEMVQALQSVGKESLVDLALHEEHRRGTSQVSLMLKYGVMRNRFHKVITGMSRPGGSQYQQNIKKEMKGELTVPEMKKATVNIKAKTSTQAGAPKRRQDRGKTSTKK